MQGEADGDGGRTRHNTRKRDLHDTPQDGPVKYKPSSKRRLTASAQGHEDAESTSNGSRFKSRERKVERNSTSESPKPQLDNLQFSLRSSGPPAPPAPQRYGSFDSPFSNDSAARPSGPSGATGGRWGATPSLPGGFFSGYGHYKSNQSPLTTEIPTASTRSSGAHSIPAHSNSILPFPTSKRKTRASLDSLRNGFGPANEVAAEEDGHNDKPHQEAGGRSYNTRRDATGTQTRPPRKQDAVQPSSRVNGTRDTPQAITSSDDDSYVEEREEQQDSDDDAVPTTRQRSARLKVRDSTSLHVSDDGLNNERGVEQGSYKETPSGKDYHELPHPIWNEHSPKFVLIPDGYKLKHVPGLKGGRFPCPVRTCPHLCKTLERLDNHFETAHIRSKFNDNLDGDATIEYVGQSNDDSSREPIIVSRNPRHPDALTKGSSTLRAERKKNDAVEVIANEKPRRTFNLGLDGSASSGDAPLANSPSVLSELNRAMAESKVWAYVEPLIPKSWAASITEGLEERAFIQAISLPLRNEMDMEWLAGTKGSHQRLYRALMSVIFQAIGIEAHCKPCDSKIPERRRNCKVLPPEATNMQELQKVCGSQCVNCFFFQASRPCELPDSSTTTKQTPIPVPIPPFQRTTPVIERSLDPPAAANTLRPTVASRPFVPSYSLYKAQKTDKPISESPVPIPSFATQGPSRQSQLHSPSAEADEWEIAPGKLVDGKPVAFSTSFLRREELSLDAAQKLRPNHRVLNKSIAALHQVHIDPEKDPERGWNCTFSVIRGVLKIKAGDVEARIGQGGMVLVEEKCIITNVLHKDATIQVCWVKEG